ncbi:hypothetical protein BH11ACT5_BH11ACT5_02640 [soil metagenome]
MPIDVADLLSRAAEVADAARGIRQNAQDAGQPLVALRAGDAELRSLTLLADRFGVDDTTVPALIAWARIVYTSALAVAVTNPEFQAALSAELRRHGEREGAEDLEQLAEQRRAQQRELNS